jgi:hypothetical protein
MWQSWSPAPSLRMWPYNMQVLETEVSQSQISKAAAGSIDNTIGRAEVHHIDGAREDWVFLQLKKVLVELCREAENFREALRETVEESGLCPHATVVHSHKEESGNMKPHLHFSGRCLHDPRCVVSCVLAGPFLNLVLYADGITPGSPLVADNRRKSIAWYISFLEFKWRLAYEEAWTPIAFARTCSQIAPLDVGCECCGNIQPHTYRISSCRRVCGNITARHIARRMHMQLT